MADSIFDFDPIAANNTSFAGTPYGPNQLYHNQIDNLFRAYAGALGGFVDDLGAVATPTGTATAIAVTLSQGFTGYGTAAGEIRHGTLIALKMPLAATAAATLAVNAIAGTKKIRRQGDAAIEANDWLANGVYFFRYDTAYDTANGAWVLLNPAFSAASVETTWQNANTPINLSLVASVGSSALTVAIKGHDGNDPSSSNKVYIPVRNVTATSGDMDVLALTAATSLVISSGSTLGAPTGSVPFKVWVVGFNDGGTFRLGAILCTTLASGVLTQFPLAAHSIASSTAEGGAGAADTAQTFYTGTAVTSKAYTVLGVLSFESGLATAGTWASAPTRVQIFDASVRLPGSQVQMRRTQTGAVASGTTIMPYDDTIPQNTEGDQYLSQAITPTSSANIVLADACGFITSTGGTATITGALFQDSVADAIAARPTFQTTATGTVIIGVSTAFVAATSSSTTIKFRAGANGAGTTTLNGASGARVLGGVASSVLDLREIAA